MYATTHVYRCKQDGAVTALTAPPQDDSLLLPSGARMPLVGFGTYKVDKADSVRYAYFSLHARCWTYHTNIMQVLGQITCQSCSILLCVLSTLGLQSTLVIHTAYSQQGITLCSRQIAAYLLLCCCLTSRQQL